MSAIVMALCDAAAGCDLALCETQWRELLAFADRTLSTPWLRGLGPAWLQDEVELRIGKIAQKSARLRETYLEAAQALTEAGIVFVVLKGFANPGTVPRAQNDIDLWVKDAGAATRVLLAAGFVRHRGVELSYNHVAPLLKPYSWQWRGDYFDPDMPVPIELHYSLWNEDREKIAAPGIGDFWDRRVVEKGVPALAPGDRLGFAALHLMRHVLRNNVRPAQAFELGQWAGAAEPNLWAAWHRDHAPALRDLEALGVCLASAWIGRPSPVELPERARVWFERYRMSPLENLIRPNKDSLRLQLALVRNPLDQLLVARRRLIPLRLPRREEAADGSYARFLWGRVRYHAVALTRFGTRISSARDTAD